MTITKQAVAQQFSVGIIGCGWLGKALAKTLINSGSSVIATSSKVENVAALNQQGIKACQLALPSNLDTVIQNPVFAQQCLVIAIPPQFRQGRTDYSDNIELLVKAAQVQGKVKRIILISTTAIYAGLAHVVDENSQPCTDIEKVALINKAEQAVLAFPHQANVLRLAGLVGPERHPGKFLQAKKSLSHATGAINLIHQVDALGLITSLMTEQSPVGIFNGVSDNHPSKKVYYQRAAQSLSLPIPHFADNLAQEPSRIVSGEKAKRELSHVFTYPDLLAWV